MDLNLWKLVLSERYYYDNNKQKSFEIDKSRILCDQDQLLKIQL